MDNIAIYYHRIEQAAGFMIYIILCTAWQNEMQECNLNGVARILFVSSNYYIVVQGKVAVVNNTHPPNNYTAKTKLHSAFISLVIKLLVQYNFNYRNTI